ncbi:hypothetical protein BASA81_004819 [Batrachochytrium salamandrivorans]|nr:hypothetical protein BASA81_004819 [Batrachochytrium salamandrivorans]
MQVVGELLAQKSAGRERAFVTLTYAQTLDGCIALKQPEEPLILSSPESMKLTHELRAFHDGILVGVNTVLADDPSLTTRLVEGSSPRPIVLDSQLRTPLTCKLFARARDVVVVCDSTESEAKLQAKLAMEQLGATVMVENDLLRLFTRLRQEVGISRVMAEGGAKVIRSLMNRPDLVDCVLITISPTFLGQAGLAPSLLLPLDPLPKVDILAAFQLGKDICLVGELN